MALPRSFASVVLVEPHSETGAHVQTGVASNPLSSAMYFLNTITLMWEPWAGGVGGGGGGGDASAANQTIEITRLTSILAQHDVLRSTRSSEVTLAAVLAKLSADPATQATLAAILAKQPATPSLEGGNLATIAGKDFATQATLALIKAKTDNLDVLLSTRTKPTDVQPVSGPLTDAQLRAANVPVSGAFFQATQPVSLAAGVDVTDRLARILGVTGLRTDQNRVWKSIRFTSAAAPAAETVCNCILNTDGVDAAGAVSFAVTAGKVFRMLYISASTRTTTAATPWGRILLRCNPVGAAVIGSPIVHGFNIGGTAAVIGNVAADILRLEGGWDFSGTKQIALTFQNNVATNVTDIIAHGYEYTP